MDTISKDDDDNKGIEVEIEVESLYSESSEDDT